MDNVPDSQRSSDPAVPAGTDRDQAAHPKRELSADEMETPVLGALPVEAIEAMGACGEPSLGAQPLEKDGPSSGERDGAEAGDAAQGANERGEDEGGQAERGRAEGVQGQQIEAEEGTGRDGTGREAAGTADEPARSGAARAPQAGQPDAAVDEGTAVDEGAAAAQDTASAEAPELPERAELPEATEEFGSAGVGEQDAAPVVEETSAQEPEASQDATAPDEGGGEPAAEAGADAERGGAAPLHAVAGKKKARKAASDRKKTERVYLPASISRSILAGIEAAVLPWALVVAIAIGIFASQRERSAFAALNWTDALDEGTRWWAAGFGATVHGLTLPVPLGLTALFAAIAYLAIRRAHVATLPTLGAAVAANIGSVATLTALAAGMAARLQAIRGAVAVAALVALLCLLRDSELRNNLRQRGAKRRQARPAARAGGRDGAARLRQVGASLLRQLAHLLTGASAVLAALWAAGTLVMVVSAAVRWRSIWAMGAEVQLGAVGWLAVGAVFLFWLPTLGLWGVAWLFGSGFRLDQTSLYSLEGFIPSVQPAMPFLSGVPVVSPGWALLLAPGALLAALGWWMARRKPITWRSGGWALVLQLLHGAAIAAVATVGVSLLFVLARGALGTAPVFASAGPVPAGQAAGISVFLLLAFVPAYAVSHPQVWPLVRLALVGSAREAANVGAKAMGHARSVGKVTATVAMQAARDLSRSDKTGAGAGKPAADKAGAAPAPGADKAGAAPAPGRPGSPTAPAGTGRAGAPGKVSAARAPLRSPGRASGPVRPKNPGRPRPSQEKE